MKTILIKYFISIFAATYFLVAGMGYNVVKYCCDSCEHEGIEEVELVSCNAIHHNSISPIITFDNNEKTCHEVLKELDSCELLRLKTDIASNIVQKPCFENSVTHINYYNLIPEFNLNEPKPGIQSVTHPPDNYLITSGRTKITLHAALII
jgi:hypothetical protein